MDSNWINLSRRGNAGQAAPLGEMTRRPRTNEFSISWTFIGPGNTQTGRSDGGIGRS